MEGSVLRHRGSPLVIRPPWRGSSGPASSAAPPISACHHLQRCIACPGAAAMACMVGASAQRWGTFATCEQGTGAGPGKQRCLGVGRTAFRLSPPAAGSAAPAAQPCAPRTDLHEAGADLVADVPQSAGAVVPAGGEGRGNVEQWSRDGVLIKEWGGGAKVRKQPCCRMEAVASRAA